MKSRYWGDKNKKVDFPAEYSSWRDPHEGIWIDALRFQQLFLVLTPWGASEMGEALAERCFRVSTILTIGGFCTNLDLRPFCIHARIESVSPS